MVSASGHGTNKDVPKKSREERYDGKLDVERIGLLSDSTSIERKSEVDPGRVRPHTLDLR